MFLKIIAIKTHNKKIENSRRKNYQPRLMSKVFKQEY